ncbi:hypothetical protein [Mycobacterium leprae]|uniref:hypothetical protein n=1 Tax=Mycobacterium leprae TaxID=1769 RepID=UPI000300C942|nr:hypothetical protein [Mycobacterium leprae]
MAQNYLHQFLVAPPAQHAQIAADKNYAGAAQYFDLFEQITDICNNYMSRSVTA